jgi:beta-lactamase regulating signal transducer with metallopeptidase domain
MTHTIQHTIQAVAWTLIHFCWQGAAIAALFAAANKLLAHRSSNARYLVALVALLLMLAASAATFSWEMRSGSGPVSFIATATPSTAPADNHTGYKFSPTVTPASDAPHATDVSSITEWLPWIDAFWLIGVVVLSCRSLGGWWLIQRLRTAAAEEAPAAVIASFQRIAAALGLERPVMLSVSKTIAGPLTVGVLRALVLLPLSAVTSLSEEELQVVLAHELAHIRRADFFWNLVQTFIETLFFFHPAVWWIGGRLRHERELCCDDLALKVCPDRLVYARALYRLEEQRRSNWQLAMALDGHQPAQTLRMRIARILGEPLAHTTGRGPFSIAAAGALLVVLLLPVPQVMASLDPSPRQPQSAASVQGTVAPQLNPMVAQAVALPAPRKANPAPLMIAQANAAEPQQNAAESSQQTENENSAQTTPSSSSHHDYIDEMKAAGYDVDLDKMVAMKIQGVTAEYARQMSQLGFGKLTADQLIACKIQDVTADYIAKMKRDGLEVKSIQDAISYRIFNLTPEFIAGMKAAGFDNLDHKQLMALRVQGVTPEYARSIRQQYPGATVDDIVKTKIFNINADFIADAKRHGFTDLTLDKLVKLRISGILDDESDSK